MRFGRLLNSGKKDKVFCVRAAAADLSGRKLRKGLFLALDCRAGNAGALDAEGDGSTMACSLAGSSG